LLLALVGPNTPLSEIALWLAISGIGQGLFLAPNTSAVMSAVPAEDSGTSSGLIATTRVVGQTLSVAIAGAVFVGLGGAAAGAALIVGRTSGSLFDPVLDNTFLSAMHAALLVSGVLAAAGATISLAGVVGLRSVRPRHSRGRSGWGSAETRPARTSPSIVESDLASFDRATDCRADLAHSS
jgi:hypothetical protein